MPEDQQHSDPSEETDYEGLAYLGEYPLSWASCTANESIYNLLLEKGADPDAQDSFGNTVLHMVVVTNQMVKVSYHLRSKKSGKSFLHAIFRECLVMPSNIPRNQLIR